MVVLCARGPDGTGEGAGERLYQAEACCWGERGTGGWRTRCVR